jgi:ribosomal protein L37AE/L43A
MAIFRITSRTRRADLAKKSIRYIVHRRSREQPTITRTLYDPFGITDKDAAYSQIDRTGAWGTCFRTVISPDPALEDSNRDLDLRLLTEATMQALRLRLKDKAFTYFAAIHTDHSNNRHIHVLLLLKKHRLSKADLKAFKGAATENAREQRRLLDKTQEQTQGVEERPICSACGPTQAMQRLSKTRFHCTSCGRIVEDRGLHLAVVREAALTLFQGLEVGAV